MKRIISLAVALLFIPALAVLADSPWKGEAKPKANGNGAGNSSRQTSQPRQPVVINMGHPASGGHNQNFPSQRPQPQPQAQPAARVQPSYGRLNWTAPARAQSQPQANNPQARVHYFQTNRPNVQAYTSPGVNAAVAVHHHPYTQGYVRKKLQKIGVSQEPSLITDRAEIIHTSKQYSAIRFPNHGPDRMDLHATIVSPRHFNDPIVRNHMALVDSADWHDRIQGFNHSEMEHNHYYWHTDNSFNYCHYIDGQGYHWWGWYVGDQFFWNRYYAGRWWWYDSDFDRWCFWNEGFWWWQDPYHVGDLYCYNNDTYIPCNSANDQEVVTAPDTQDYQTYNSPDNSCQVRVINGTQDAFLYDTDGTNPNQPVYLASGVESVSFSDTSTGRPLEIVLKLNDGSFDMFDDDGNPYGPGNYDADQAAQGDDGDSTPPPPGQGS